MSDSMVHGDSRPARGIARRLEEMGMSASAAREKAELFARAEAALEAEGLAGERRYLYVPGRVEILGKHTDYAGGRSVIAAVERGFCIVAIRRRDNVLRMFHVAAGEQASFKLDPELSPQIGHWTNYPMTVARRAARNFPGPLAGADVAFVSDLPPAAGMSSSSGLVIGCFLVLAHFNSLDQRKEYIENINSIEELAGYLGTNENGQSFGTLAGDKGVGTFGGSEDHTAILCSLAGKLKQYRYCPVRLERTIDWPEEMALAIGVSGVISEKTGQAMRMYNRASAMVGAIMTRWQASGRSDVYLADALAAAGGPEPIRKILREGGAEDFTPAELLRRFDHFIEENEKIIPAFANAVAGRDWDRVGEAVDRSQDGTESLLCNQVAETIFLARSARRCGAVAASAFGAGFGGSVWAMVPRERIEPFLKEWQTQYAATHPKPAARATFFQTRPGPPAFTWE